MLYKRIANAKNEEDLRQLQVEMIDRFGLLPRRPKTCLQSPNSNCEPRPLAFTRSEAGSGGGRLIFHPNPPIDPAQVIRLIQTQPQTYKLDGPDKLKFFARFDTPESKVVFVDQLLEQLAA